MAVEIPVYVDIDGAFQEAAKDVPKASAPLLDQVERVGNRMSSAIQKAMKVAAKPLKAGGIEQLNTEMSRYLNTARLASNQMLKLGEAQGKLTAGRVNIKAISSEVSVLANKWNSMKLSAKFDPDGKLRVRAQEVIDKMSKLTSKTLQFGEALANSSSKASLSMGKTTASVNSTNAALTTQAGILKKLTGYLSGYTLLFTGLRFIHNIRETTAELEMQRVALGGILNDTEKATELFRQIKAAALKSPFEIKDLVTYTKQLSAYRIETDKLFDVTMRLADVSAGLGIDMNRLILAYGQVRAASVLRGQELRQFTEAGIPLVELLAEKFRKLGREGTTTADVFELISKRAVPFKLIEEIFNDMTNAGGVFYQMQERQSETLKGQWMKLKDAITIMYDEMGNTKVVHDAMTSFIQTANNLTRSWRDVANWIKAVTAALITYNVIAKASVLATNSITKAEALRLAVMKSQTIAMPKIIAAIVGETTAKKVSRTVTRQLAIAQYNLATATTVAEKALWKMYAALISNPYALAATAVVGLGAALYTLVKNSREADISIDGLEQSVTRFRNSIKKQNETDDLLAAYEELRDKTGRTREEEEKLIRVTNDLARTFPSAVTGINEHSGALDIDIQKVKDLTEAEQKLELARLKRDEKNARRQVRKLEEEKNEIIENQQRGGYYLYQGTPEETFIKYTEDELADFGERLAEINKDLKPFKDQLEQIRELEQELGIGNYYSGGGQGGGARSGSLGLEGWRSVLKEIEKEKEEAGMHQIYSDDDIKNMESVYNLYKKTKKAIEEDTTALEGLKALNKTLTGEAKEANEAEIALVEKELDFHKTVQDRFNFVFKKGGGSYQQDPFIKQMQERIKFMKDFRKGYEDLNKYMDENAALKKEGDIMRTRGLALGLSEAEQKKAAKDLADWYGSEMNRIYADVQKKYNLSMTLEQFLSQEINAAGNRGKALKDWQNLLQSIFNDQTDLNTEEAKKTLEKAIQKLRDELKRSEAAKNFFQDILGLTGDQELAANLAVSVYGDPGKELQDRLMDSLKDAFDSEAIPWDSLMAIQMRSAIKSLDFSGVMAKLDEFPDKIKEVVKEMAGVVEKYNADIAKSYAKLLVEYDELAQQRIDITQKAAEKIRQIEEGLRVEILGMEKRGASAAEISAAKSRAKLATDAVNREAEIQLSRLEAKYRLFFSSVGIISQKSAMEVAQRQRKMLSDQFVRGQISLSKYKRELKEISNQLGKYSGVEQLEKIASGKFGELLVDQINSASEGLLALSSTVETMDGFLVADDDTKKFLDRLDKILNFGDFVGIFTGKKKTSIQDEINKASRRAYQNAILSGESAEVANKKADEAARNVLNRYSNQMSESAQSLSIAAAALKAVCEIYEKIGAGLSEIFDQLERSGHGFETRNEYGAIYDEADYADTFAHMAEFFGGMVDLLSLDLGGAWKKFSALSNEVRENDRAIKYQGELVNDLKYSYDRLGAAIENAFGSDYISLYNQQLENLGAQADAYRKQAEAERAKGKSADEEKARGYERSAQQIEDQITDAQSKLAEFMSGTDLTSAAKEFAEAWIEAYKEFGSTTDAMKEKFNDMIQNMVVNSLAAQLIQSILKPIFDQIDSAAADGALTAQEIAQISAMVPGAIDQINSAMTGMVGELTSAGYNLRQQAGSFTGISRDIAGASEESITGLAAGINTQNFYISHIDANVAAILSALTGGASTAGASVTGEYIDPYKDFVKENIQLYFPSYDQKLGDILNRLDRVIRPRTDRPDYVLHTNL